MRFFFDRCMSPRIARMVGGFEVAHTTRHHNEDSRFDERTLDVEWMRALHEDGDPAWVIVSGDCRILRDSIERAVLNEIGLTFFGMTRQWMNMRIEDWSWRFMKVWPQIVDEALHSKYKLFEVSGGRSLKVEPYRG